MIPRLNDLIIRGYRALNALYAPLGSLEVLVGANGAGKSCLFELLRFVRDAMSQEIPPAIFVDALGQKVFHRPGPERIEWQFQVQLSEALIGYFGRLYGPVGKAQVAAEYVVDWPSAGFGFTYLSVEGGEGRAAEQKTDSPPPCPIVLKRQNQSALSLAMDPRLSTLCELRKYIESWRFYSSFKIATEKIRQSVFIEQEPVLREDGGNLAAVLHYLLTEYPTLFNEVQQHLRSVVPGFKSLAVRAQGGPGQVLAFWQEEGVETELTLADLSHGEGERVVLVEEGKDVAEIRPLHGESSSQESALQKLVEEGVVIPAEAPRQKFVPAGKSPGALARFLEARR